MNTMIDRIDGLATGAAIKGPCKAATTANIALYGEQTIDGVALVEGDRVLVKDQTAAYENGAYVVDTGQWRRVKDFNKTRDVLKGTLIYVADGTENSGCAYVITSDLSSVGESNIIFQAVFVRPGAGLIDALEAAIPLLPTSLPATAGKLWNNGGMLSIS